MPEEIQHAYKNHIFELLDNYMIMDSFKIPRLILEIEKSAFSEWRDFQNYVEIQLRPGGKLYPIKG